MEAEEKEEERRCYTKKSASTLMPRQDGAKSAEAPQAEPRKVRPAFLITQTLYTLTELTSQYVCLTLVLVTFPIHSGITHIIETLRLTRNIRVTTGVDLRTRSRAPDATSPISTERNVEYNVQIPELAVEVTASEVRYGCAPSSRIGVAISDVCRHIAGGEVPYLDARCRP
jgi:hypothetical protein